MTKYKILITSRSYGRYFPEHLEALRKIGEPVYAEKVPMKEDQLADIIKEYDALLAGVDEVSSKVIKKAENLKIIARHGVGVDTVDLKAATENGVVVTYTPGANTNAVAEHALALMLAIIRDIPNAHSRVKELKWGGGKLTIELSGKVLGIIGLGNIGRRLATICKCLGMDVISYSPRARPEDAAKIGVKLVSLEELLTRSDVVAVTTSYSPEKYHLINEERLKMMKKNSYIVNVARGELIDEKALAKALKENWIAGAALDVMEKEPPSPDNELLQLSNIVITHHTASHTLEALKNMGDIVTEDILLALGGKLPKNIANPEVLDNPNLRIKLSR
ncbi:MAG: phosphoglycerate dehydrogenase [Aigarchaeota archaeon]|nr:phosphoglycerate dehydrogenase [Aigarchaeota archaeon]MCX8193221.1 phosphoglycerate dehydrogenase [Nitrososphaeria archaeon]MDW7986362.1 phosphoglycerate dehydrogenase [Nitrososphaerota archaeon]